MPRKTANEIQMEIEKLQAELEDAVVADEITLRNQAARGRMRMPLPNSLGQVEEHSIEKANGKTYGPYFYRFEWDPGKGEQRSHYIGKTLDQDGAQAFAMIEYRSYAREIRKAEADALRRGKEIPERNKTYGMTAEEWEVWRLRVEDLIGIEPGEYQAKGFRSQIEEKARKAEQKTVVEQESNASRHAAS